MSIITFDNLIFKENSYLGWTVMCRESGHKSPTVNIPPSLLSGFVTNIAHEAFQSDTFLEEITIPAIIEKIGHHAFANCCYLGKVHFLTSQISLKLREKSFSNCQTIKEVQINRPVVVEKDVFSGCTSLRTVSGLFTSIGEKSFSNCKNLESVCFESSVEICETAFLGCSKLKEFIIKKDILGSIEFVKHLPRDIKIKCSAESRLLELVYDGYCVEVF